MKPPERKSASSKSAGRIGSAIKTPKRQSQGTNDAKKADAVVGETTQKKRSGRAKLSEKAPKKLVKVPAKATTTKTSKAILAIPERPLKASKPVIALEVEKKGPVARETTEAPREIEDQRTVASKPIEGEKGKSIPQEESRAPILKPGKAAESSRPALKVKAKATEKPLNIPPILLEGDLPPSPKLAGPGTRYALSVQAPVVPNPRPSAEATELPEGYGTQRLFLTARDPRWLYASWDLMPEQQREYNRRSQDGHLVLRVYAEAEAKPVVPDVHVNPESRNFFINVPRPETRYWAELGISTRAGAWEQITKSQSTFTPPDAPSPEPAAVAFATIPVQVTFEQVVKTVQEFVTGHEPLLESVIAAQEAQKREERAREMTAKVQSPVESSASRPAVAPRPASPAATEMPISLPAAERVQFPLTGQRRRAKIPIRVERAETWTAERKEALRRLISIDGYRRVWMGSIEITELVRRQLEEEIGSIAAAELARQAAEAAGPGVGLVNISSPPGGEIPGRARKFWFKVNAELIIYGATEPDAKVTVADRPVKLRPDGTFSFRFALPDGRYALPALAASADGVEAREAILEFSRTTDYRGEMQAHPQDPGLRSPRPENL
jgi:hypothetical protein